MWKAFKIAMGVILAIVLVKVIFFLIIFAGVYFSMGAQ